MTNNLFIVISLLLFFLAYCFFYVGRRPKGLPPGPPTLPGLGNLHQLAKAGTEPHFLFQKWAREYGPIYSLILGNKVQIVLSSDQAVKGLLDAKGAVASSRPELYFAFDLSSRKYRFSLQSYGQQWRIQRKVAHNGLNAKKTADYAPYLEVENKQLLFDIMQDSTSILPTFRRSTASMMASIVFGFRWNSSDHPQLQELFRIIGKTSELAAANTAPLADFYPILRYIPAFLYPLKQRTMTLYDETAALYKSFYLSTKYALLNKPASVRPCLSINILALQQAENLSNDQAALFAGNLVEAGGDTTSSSLYTFVQAMLLYPDIQRTAQAEVDALCGDSRWPEIDDMAQLPYIRACVKELMRWLPVAPLGVPHALTEATDYMGYQLPAGASVMPNIWTIHHDPERYPNPQQFSPERFLGDDTTSSESSVLTDVSARDHFAFGAGRRICPGIHVADRSLRITIARLVWGFNVKGKIGSDGKVKFPEPLRTVGGLGTRPRDFESVLEVRGEKRAELIRELWEEAKQGLDDEGQYLK